MPAFRQDALTPVQRDDIKELVLGTEEGKSIAMQRYGLRLDQLNEVLESMSVQVPWYWDTEE